MTFIVVVEPNPLLRLGILHLLSKANSTLNLAGYDHLQLEHYTAVQPCDLAIISVSRCDDIARVVQNVEQACAPKAVLLLYDSTEISPSLTVVSSLIAGCVYKHAAPEVLQAATQMVLAGGSCFPNKSWTEKSQTSLLSLYNPEKWPPLEAGAIPNLARKPTLPPPLPTIEPALHSEAPLVSPPPVANRASAPSTAASVANESEMLGLTPRQYEVLVLLARGYPMKTVGRQLNISVATAKAHTESLYQRLDVRNRNAAVYTAIARGATLGWASISGNQSPPSRP